MSSPSRAELSILFTSAGRRVELLRAFRRAYTELRLAGNIVAVDINPLAPALQIADRVYLVPRISDSAYVPTLTEICRRESVRLIFPLIDPDIQVLTAHREAFEAVDCTPVVVSPPAASVAADKWETLRLFRSVGIATPRSWLPETLVMSELEFPLFLKPRFGSAGQHTYRVDDRAQLDFLLPRIPDAMVQELLPGPEVTSDVVCDLGGRLLGVVNRRRLEVRSGEVSKGVTIFDPTICEACSAIARGLPAVGPINVQCMMKDGVPHFTEINARFGGGAPLSIAAGADFPKWLLESALGLVPSALPMGSYTEGLFLTRFDESFFVTSEEYDQLAGRRL
jgi:carbamoyl-phosphate synthase large subunit